MVAPFIKRRRARIKEAELAASKDAEMPQPPAPKAPVKVEPAKEEKKSVRESKVERKFKKASKKAKAE